MPDMNKLLADAGLQASGRESSSGKGGPGAGKAGSAPPRHGGPPRDNPGRSPFPEHYPDYFDGEGVLKQEFLTSLAENIAIALGDARLSKVQMRHFYNYVRRRQASREAGKPPREVLNDIAQLKSIAHRQKERGAIPETFAIFVERNVDKCVDDKAFLKGFVKHFQAVLAFSEGRLRERA